MRKVKGALIHPVTTDTACRESNGAFWPARLRVGVQLRGIFVETDAIPGVEAVKLDESEA